jgi:hypothetical protein
MIRTALALSLILDAAPVVGHTQASDVRVTIGPELARKAERLGRRDIDRLAAELEASVEQAVGRGDGGALELVLTDAVPSRPTFEEMARRPGLDMRSVANGGATIDGVEIGPDGTRRPIHFAWYEDDIRWASARATWTDTHKAFRLFARQYASGRR